MPQKGEATVLDIGGMDNKVITVNDGIPDNFTMGGICAVGSSSLIDIGGLWATDCRIYSSTIRNYP